MKATIDIPNCIHLHACNRFRVIAQKRGIIHDEFIGVYDSQIDEMEEGNNDED